jgi:CheY-like chemotaxis protein
VSRILLVSDRSASVFSRVSALKAEGHVVALVEGYQEARAALGTRRHELLVAPIRLGAYNGLHLALHARGAKPPVAAMVVDVAYDPVTEFEAYRSGASYVAEPLETFDFVALVGNKLAASLPRRWPRTPVVGGMPAQVHAQDARLLDMSYGGLCLEFREGNDVSGLDVALPEFGVTLQARPVWTRKSPRGQLLCGAEITETNPMLVQFWRGLVDSSTHPGSAAYAGQNPA